MCLLFIICVYDFCCFCDGDDDDGGGLSDCPGPSNPMGKVLEDYTPRSRHLMQSVNGK